MKTLFVLRHAKSDWSTPGQDDHERSLSDRGERAALVMGRYMDQKNYRPDFILCSDARRAADTLEIVTSQWKMVPPIEMEPALYLAGRSGVLKRLGAVVSRHESVMVVGHNPDLHEVVASLAQTGSVEWIQSAAGKFPTTALAVLELPIDHWREAAKATGDMVDYATPKTLV